MKTYTSYLLPLIYKNIIWTSICYELCLCKTDINGNRILAPREKVDKNKNEVIPQAQLEAI